MAGTQKPDDKDVKQVEQGTDEDRSERFRETGEGLKVTRPDGTTFIVKETQEQDNGAE